MTGGLLHGHAVEPPESMVSGTGQPRPAPLPTPECLQMLQLVLGDSGNVHKGVMG